ncbi:uncharacterized protein LOC130694286 isoform X2 [Daphnia carinata]|uniref:uncharacterized protein LOC130694286 isoform X2 n=1 Tax=Daphnia carinata TaxID=120202 RepID=UPI0028684E9D|nr:uncharacterized protein LOC130694286 isoform X2 [Daphnia carinata]
MCSRRPASSSSKHISSLWYLLAVIFAVRCGVSPSIDNDIFSMRSPIQCFRDDLIPVLKITWDEFRVEVNQVPETGSVIKYFLQSEGANLRSTAVACISTQNLPLFKFSITGNLLNQPVEFYFDPMLGDTNGFFHYPKSAKKLSFWLKKMGDQQDGEMQGFPWNFFFQYVIQDTPFINGTLSTNCNLYETNSKPMCIYKSILNFPTSQVSWVAQGKIHRSSDSSILSARLTRSASHQPIAPLFFNANWNTSQESFSLSSDLVLGEQSLLSLAITSSFLNGWQLHLEILSFAFDWRWSSNLSILPKQDGREVTAISEGNYLFQPSPIPIRYRFGLLEGNSSSQVFMLRHNISSALYRFEGNMSIDVEPTDSHPEIITKITQKIRTSSLERPLRLDLQQIFHESGYWTWETVVLRSGLFDMHVSGHWNDTVLQHYRKLFQIHSHDEDCLPSMNLELDYSDRRRFYHQISYPFLACSYGLLVQLSDTSRFLPAEVKILYRDEFKANHSRSILQLKLSEVNSILNAKVSTEWSDINRMTAAIKNHLDKITNWMADEQHPINQLLKPILRRPTLAKSFADALKWLENYSGLY